MSDDIVVCVVRALDDLGVSYMVTGALASNTYGIVRSTLDADFVVELGEVPIAVIAERLLPALTLDPQASFEAIASFNTRYRFESKDTGYAVDLFVLSDDPYDQARFQRRRTALVHNIPVYVPTAEDVVITKLLWSRNRRGSNDRDDARDVMAVQGDELDWPYIERWCRAHGTLELLEQIRAELAE